MTEYSVLVEKQQKIKRRLETGKYRTLIDVTFDWTGRLIQRVTHYPRPISAWNSATILYLLFLVASFIGLFILGEATSFKNQFAPFSPAFVPLSFMVGYFNVLTIVAGNFYIHRVFTTFQDSVIDTMESEASLEDFEHWLNGVCNRKIHFLFSIVGGFLVGMYQVSVLRQAGVKVLPSTAIGTVLLNTFSVVFLYLLIYMIILSARTGKYHLKLNTAYPANSEVINRLADLLGNFVLLVAIYATLLTLIVTIQQFLTQLGIVVILLFWIPITGMFVLNQNSLSRIIKRTKLKVLNQIQEKVEQLHASNYLDEKETMDTINRLMDYHERINRTRSSRIDSGSILNLINSLLLPLIALALANTDKILALLK